MRPVDRLGRLDPPPLDPALDPLRLSADELPLLRPGATPEGWSGGLDHDLDQYADAGRTLPLDGGARYVADGSGTDPHLPTRLADRGD